MSYNRTNDGMDADFDKLKLNPAQLNTLLSCILRLEGLRAEVADGGDWCLCVVWATEYLSDNSEAEQLQKIWARMLVFDTFDYARKLQKVGFSEEQVVV